MDTKDILKQMLSRETKAVDNLINVLDFDILEKVAEEFICCKGNVIFAGCGGSSAAAYRAANIYNFLYVPSIAVNVLNCLHGEFGMLRKEDIFVAISKSGNTKELVQSIEIAKKFGCKIISLTETEDSYLAKNADLCILFKSGDEVDDLQMVATTSTTVESIILDMIVGTIMRLKGITEKDFKLIHPNGAVGDMLREKEFCEDQ